MKIIYESVADEQLIQETHYKLLKRYRPIREAIEKHKWVDPEEVNNLALAIDNLRRLISKVEEEYDSRGHNHMPEFHDLLRQNCFWMHAICKLRGEDPEDHRDKNLCELVKQIQQRDKVDKENARWAANLAEFKALPESERRARSMDPMRTPYVAETYAVGRIVGGRGH